MRLRAAVLAVVLVPAAFVAGTAAHLGPHGVSAATGCAAGQSSAGVVVTHAGGGTVSATVCFPGGGGSAEQAIAASGIQHDFQSFPCCGQAVCQMDYEPQPRPADCFGSVSWVVWVARACSGWVSSSLGVSSLHLGNGDLVGLHYGRGTPAGPGGFCPPQAPPPTAPPAAPPSPTPPPPTAAATATGAVDASATRPPPGPAGHGPASTPGAGTQPAAPGTPAAETITPDPAASTVTAAAGAVAGVASPGAGGTAVAVGPVLRTGAAPPPPPSGGSALTWVLLGVAVLALGGLGAWQLNRRRAT